MATSNDVENKASGVDIAAELAARDKKIMEMEELLAKLTAAASEQPAQTTAEPAARDNSAYLKMIEGLRARKPKTVSIRLLKDDNMHKDVLPVAVNGKQYWVPRGISLTVPYAVAEVIEYSVKQEELAQGKIEKMADAARFG